MLTCTCPTDFRVVPAPSPDCARCWPQIERVARSAAFKLMPDAVNILTDMSLDRVQASHRHGTFLGACQTVNAWPNAVWYHVRKARLDLLRKAKRPLDEVVDVEPDEMSVYELPVADQTELQFFAEEALESLDQRDAYVVWSRCNGYSFKEIGNAVGTSESNAAKIYNKAIKRLRKQMRRRGWDG